MQFLLAFAFLLPMRSQDQSHHHQQFGRMVVESGYHGENPAHSGHSQQKRSEKK
jgi:hypothetical protein